MEKQKSLSVPDGYNAVNPFMITDKATLVIQFITEVFGGVESKEALTYDDDGLVLHSEVRVGNATIMLADRKKEWRMTPSFLQVYVSNLDEVLELALAHGAVIITKPTEYIGVKFSRIQDPYRNLWWIYEPIENYDWESAFDAGNEDGSWKPTKEATYIHDTLLEVMKELARD